MPTLLLCLLSVDGHDVLILLSVSLAGVGIDGFLYRVHRWVQTSKLSAFANLFMSVLGDKDQVAFPPYCLQKNFLHLGCCFVELIFCI